VVFGTPPSGRQGLGLIFARKVEGKIKNAGETPAVRRAKNKEWGPDDASFVIREAGEDFGGVVGISAAVPELEGAGGEGFVGEASGRPEGRRYMY
jgi:hypothetical protein